MKLFLSFTQIFLLVYVVGCTSEKVQVKLLDTFPSGSAIEFADGHIYLVGDDAPYLMILDKKLNHIDSVRIVSSAAARIPKEEKPDFESIIKTKEGELLLLGSGSFEEKRNLALLVAADRRKITEIRLDTLYARLSLDFLALNVEGAAGTRDGILLCNRGNLSNPQNHLVFLDHRFWQDPAAARYKTIRIEQTEADSSFSGVSGMTYSFEKDLLILTASTENTSSAFEDGEIGASYLWFIENISKKIQQDLIKPDRIIRLDSIDPVFVNKKIESAAILGEKGNEIELVLVADNDDGRSWICITSIKIN